MHVMESTFRRIPHNIIHSASDESHYFPVSFIIVIIIIISIIVIIMIMIMIIIIDAILIGSVPKSRDGIVLIALASHLCGPGSI